MEGVNLSSSVDPARADLAVLRFRVQNVVAVARVADALPLAAIAAMIPGAEYPKRKYPGLLLRIPSPRVACRVYDSGKCVLTGLGTVEHLQAALTAVVETLRAAGAELFEPVPEARVTNLVASGSFGRKIALLRLALALDLERVEYDPELSAALVYRARAGSTASVFASGAFVVMGARSVEQARAVAAEVRGVIDTMGAWHPYA